jgi:hypothetical protein
MSDVTVGYNYYMSAQMGLCRGPIDELVQIQIGELQAWPNADAYTPTSASFSVSTLADLSTTGIFYDTGTVGEVTSDPDSDNDGLYVKTTTGTWLRLGTGGVITTGQTDTGEFTINAPDLFGGDKREGGIVGRLMAYFGKADQVLLSGDASIIGGLLPGFRDLVTLFYDGLIATNNPYPKSWRFRVRRTTKGWNNDDCWYACQVTIPLAGGTIQAMNPAHIIYEALTNPEWGRGLDPVDIDENSFKVAANTLAEEHFGMCVAWRRAEDVDKFIQVIIDYIMGTVYIDRGSGLWTLRLIRGDYDPDTIPLFTDTSGLLDIENDENVTADTAINEVIVNYRSPIDGKDKTTVVHNLAGFQSHGSIVSETLDYPYLPTHDLASRVGLRDLRIKGSSLKRLKVRLDRRAWRLTPGSVFRIEAPGRGIGSMILRAGEVNDGTLTDGAITITAVQDVFGMPATAFVAEVETTWTAPDRKPVPTTVAALLEPSHYDVVRVGETLVDDVSHVISVARQPNGLQLAYDLWTKPAGGTYGRRANGPYTPCGDLSADVGPYDTAFTLTNRASFDIGVLPRVLFIENASGIEVCEILTADISTGALTVKRGCVDTIPRAHVSGTRAWLYYNFTELDPAAYVDGELIDGKMLSRSLLGSYDLGGSPEFSHAIDLRHVKPYAPGNLQINGTPALSFTTPLDSASGDEAVFTWAHRDRITQASVIVGSSEASVGPETGVTYTARVKQLDGTLIRTVTGISAATWTYTDAMILADESFEQVRIEIEAVRDGIASWQMWSVVLTLVDHVFADEDGFDFLDEDGNQFLDEG